MSKSLVASLTLALAIAFGASAANATVVTVLGTAGPWDTNLNPSFSYSDDGAQTAPTDVAVTAGSTYSITYLSGLTTTDGVTPVDANGFCCILGPGFNSPGQYTSTAPLLNELVGTFANSLGVIVGTPFVMGDGPTYELAPNGANLLLLGINDNEYHDNTGALSIAVSATPLPPAWTMMFLGLAGIGFVAHHRQQKNLILGT